MSVAWYFALPLFGAALLVACDKGQREPQPSAPLTTDKARSAPAPPAPAPPVAEEMPAVEVVCERSAATPVPPADFADDSESAGLKGCSAEDSYYGIDVAVDYARARKCALGAKRPDGSPSLVSADVLMMIYANGRGVPANYDLALRFACRADGAPAELGGRVSRLWKARAGEKWSTPFDQCDDATSGLLLGYCSELKERINASARKARLRSATTGMPERELKALQATAQRYFEARSTKEVDQSGSLRQSMEVSERGHLNDEFARALEQLKEPAFVPPNGDARALDAEVNELLARAATCAGLDKGKQPLPGLINSSGIKETQQSWRAYRKAFVSLALKLHAGSTAEAWSAWLTQPRLVQLRELIAGC